MNILESHVGRFTVLNLEGDVDLNSSPQVRRVFDQLIQKKVLDIIVNFEKVTYLDSSGLATLIEMLQRLAKYQGNLYLVEMSEKIKNLFEITKLDKLFKIYQTQQDVVATD